MLLDCYLDATFTAFPVGRSDTAYSALLCWYEVLLPSGCSSFTSIGPGATWMLPECYLNAARSAVVLLRRCYCGAISMLLQHYLDAAHRIRKDKSNNQQNQEGQEQQSTETGLDSSFTVDSWRRSFGIFREARGDS